MSYPMRVLAGMILFMVAVVAVGALMFAPLRGAFETSIPLNSTILALLALGIASAFAQTIALQPAMGWIDQTSRGFAAKSAPRLVAPLARVLAGHEREGFVVSTVAMASLLDAVRARLDEARAPLRYLAGLLVALGLLGLLWQLVEPADARAAYSGLLFGFAGAIALGVLHLLLRHAQSRFFGELEDFLAERAQLPSSVLGGEAALPAYLEALLRQTAENLAEIQRLMTRGEEERRGVQAALDALTDRLAMLTDQLRAEQKLIMNVSRNHSELHPAMTDVANQVAGALAGSEEMRDHLRNIDVSLSRLVEEVGAVGERVPEALRQEIRVLARIMLPSDRARG
jgi:hypothetical protein